MSCRLKAICSLRSNRRGKVRQFTWTDDKFHALCYTIPITTKEDVSCVSTGSRTKITWSISTARPSWPSWRKPCAFPAANELRQHPTAEGFTIKGPKRTSGRLFVPDLTFGEHIEMGENIFFYMGEMQECYVIYWLDAPVAK